MTVDGDMDAGMISHVGIAVADLEKAMPAYRLLTGDEAPLVTEVADQKVKVAVFSGGQAHTEIELMAATAADSPVGRFIAKRGEGLHHICLYVENIEEKLAELKAAGVRLIDEIPRLGAKGNKIAFVHPEGMSGVLVELEERG